MSDEKSLAQKETQTGLVAGSAKLPAGLDGAGASDFLMPRYKIWHPMAKTEVEGAKLGMFYEVNGASAAGTTLRFHLLAQKNRSFTNADGKVKNSKNLLIVKEGQYDLPAELVLSGSGLRAAAALNTGLHVKSLEDKSGNVFSYLIEAVLELKENDKGKFAVPKFSIVGACDGETMEKLAKLYGDFAEAYSAAAAVDTATPYDENDLPV